MSTVRFPQPTIDPEGRPAEPAAHEERRERMRATACGALIAGALLMLAGKRRAGLALTATGTALTLLQEEETVRAWWEAIPVFVQGTQKLLDDAQHTMNDLSDKRDRLMALLRR